MTSSNNNVPMHDRTPPDGAKLSSSAQALAQVGLPVFPLWGVVNGVCKCGNQNCANMGKHPHKSAPHGHLQASTDQEWITRIWSSAPQANIGISLEPVDLLVIGPDSPEWLARFEKLGLPSTVVVQSGGGEGHQHYWYRRPADCPVTRSCISGQYDIISDGYAIAPPSMHRSGRAYQFIVSPADLGIDHISQLPEAPAWAVTMLQEAEAKRTDFEPVDPDEPPVPLTGRALDNWIGKNPALNHEGEVDRSLNLIRIAEDLARAGLTRRGILDALRDRDTRLWPKPKYAGRSDAEKRYTEIIDKALKATGRVTNVANVASSGTRGEGGNVAQGGDVTDVANVASFGGGEREDGATLLDDVEGFLKTYVAYPSDHARVAHTLWVAHTHAMDTWESTPRLGFLSAEPASGKTRGLELTDLLVPRPVATMNVTSAYLFRKMDAPEGMPTVLFDEIDTVFGPKAKEHEDIRALINAGHRRGATAGRCVVNGQTVNTVEFPAYSAVALAGLGDLPDTILGRSVIVQMRRRSPKETVKPFRQRTAEPVGHALRDRLAAWAPTIAQAVEQGWPEMPKGVEDRDADVWESLIAVADAAGGDWPTRAREAAVAMVQASKDKPASIGIRLLSDLRTVFDESKDEKLSTDAVITALCALPDAPWSEIRKGEPINSRGISNRLDQYGIKTTTIRIGPGKKDVARGYKRDDLEDAWTRYLPPVQKVEPADEDEETDHVTHEDYVSNLAHKDKEPDDEADIDNVANEDDDPSSPLVPELATSATSVTDPTEDSIPAIFPSFTSRPDERQ